jgi:hypothetical protein
MRGKRGARRKTIQKGRVTSMSQKTEQYLQNSLMDLDRLRKRQTVAFVLLLGTLVALLIRLGYMSDTATIDLRQMLLWAVMTIIVTVVYGGMALAVHINKSTTRKLLKAIEVLAKG